MQEVIPFNFKNKKVRVTKINEEPWFIAKDVCNALEIKEAHRAVKLLDEDERHSMTVADSAGRNQEMSVINEAGLYSLILRSRKAEAKIFKRWITHEVLPSIRMTGGYINSRATEAQIASLLNSFREEAYRRAQAEAENCLLREQNEHLVTLGLPRNFGERSNITGLPRDIFVRAYVRSDQKPHAPQNEKYIQLYLPLYTLVSEANSPAPCARN